MRLPPFVDALAEATQAKLVLPSELRDGALALARTLHSLSDDFPKAPTLVGSLFSKVGQTQTGNVKKFCPSVLTNTPLPFLCCLARFLFLP